MVCDLFRRSCQAIQFLCFAHEVAPIDKVQPEESPATVSLEMAGEGLGALGVLDRSELQKLQSGPKAVVEDMMHLGRNDCHMSFLAKQIPTVQ